MRLLSLIALLFSSLTTQAAPLRVLFLGDDGPHHPAARFAQLEPVFTARGIALTYTSDAACLSPETLKQYDALMVYANTEVITPTQEKSLLDYVENGGAFLPIHCTSFAFQNSPQVIGLVGAQFRSHQTGVFRTKIVAPGHPVMKGFPGFESWDETYVHIKHNLVGRTVLETRIEGDIEEPWTWVREQGQGRVFYTAWGHDHRTWSHPGFQTLLERGLLWATKRDPATIPSYIDAPMMTPITGQESEFTFVPAKVPFYPAGKQWGTTADPIPKMPQPLSPERSVNHFTTPVGFELKLFASDADFQGGKPIATAWDERGRLWACVTVDYPNEMQKPGAGRDKIVILEDSNQDGKADKFYVFAENLSIPTSVTIAYGGVVVHQAPDTLFLKDTNGDGKADFRQVLLHGWGTKDTHSGPSNLRYGFDGYYTGMCGYSGFNGTVNGEEIKFGQGLYRIKLARVVNDPHKLKCDKLEFLRSTSNNSWGVGFTEDGKLLGSTANGCPMVHLAVPNRFYESAAGLPVGPLPNVALDDRYHPVTDKVRQVDVHGGFTSAAGCGVYTSRSYPKEYWNQAAFVCDPTGHLCATFLLQPAGADVVSRYGWNLLAARDEWAAPIDAQVGPDGQVWVVDWYNYIVQHNPTPAGFTTGKGNAYETPLRDKKHGRIWRVVSQSGTPDVIPKLDTVEDRIAALGHPNLTWRFHAQRLLAESGDATIVAKLAPLLTDREVDELGLNAKVLHAAWLTSQLGGGLPGSLATHPAASVRRASALLATPTVTFDADPTVRLAQLLRLAESPPSPAGGAAMATLFTDSQGWRPFVGGLLPAERDAVVMAAGKQFGPLVASLAGVPSAPPTENARAIAQAAQAAATRDPALPDRVLAAGLPVPLIRVTATGFALGLPSRSKQSFTPAGQAAFGKLLATSGAAERGALLRLAGRYDAKGLEPQLQALVAGLLATVSDNKSSTTARISAALQAIELRPSDDAVAKQIVAQVSASAPPELVEGLLMALDKSQSDAAGIALVPTLPALTGVTRTAAARVVLARSGSGKAFLDAVESGKVRFDAIALDQKVALSRHPDPAIAARAGKLLAAGGGLPDPDRQRVVVALSPQLARTGDANHGRQVFETHCAKCHKHGDKGGEVGPDLTGMAAHPKEELLIAILDPSRSVEGNFRTYTASTLDGRVISGLLASETKTAVELVDAEGKHHNLRRDDLDALAESALSLMPTGFEKAMPPTDLGDLLEFLTLKGQFVPLPLVEVATADSANGLFFDANPEKFAFADTTPKTYGGVPFALCATGKPNIVMLNGPNGDMAPRMPKVVSLPCNSAAKAVHILGGVGGWSYPATPRGTVSLIVRLRYAGGATEEHELVNGVHLADYIRRVDVAGSTFATMVNGHQVRTIRVVPKGQGVIERIELIKGRDASAPIVFAVTVERP